MKTRFNKRILWMMAAILICGASVFTACSKDDDNSAGEKGQLLEIYDVQGSSGRASCGRRCSKTV